MATVFLGSLQGALGFRQIVAIKRPHPHLLEDRGFRDALLREARLAAGIHHANVVDVRDVEVVGDAVQLVMDYIEGASLGDLVGTCAREGKRIPPGIVVRVVLDACAGLHAAHELTDDDGRGMGLVHRDVSPQNVIVGVDGVARVTDFGIAKCIEAGHEGTSRETLKGKAGYMAPEYVRGESIDRRVDVFALGVVLWEALQGRRLFRGQSDAETLERMLSAPVTPVSETVPELAPLDEAVARALEREPSKRFDTMEAMARAIEVAAAAHGLVAGAPDVGRFVREAVGPRLEERRRALREAKTEAKAADPAESTTAPDVPRRRSRTRVVLVVAGALVLAGAGAVALARSGRSPAQVPSAIAATTETVPSSVTPDSPSIAPAPAAAPSASPLVSPRPSARPPARAPVHRPPPNPYPANP
jgi:eukaryotic-like serine/threonine-protein kinase